MTPTLLDDFWPSVGEPIKVTRGLGGTPVSKSIVDRRPVGLGSKVESPLEILDVSVSEAGIVVLEAAELVTLLVEVGFPDVGFVAPTVEVVPGVGAVLLDCPGRAVGVIDRRSTITPFHLHSYSPSCAQKSAATSSGGQISGSFAAATKYGSCSLPPPSKENKLTRYADQLSTLQPSYDNGTIE
ncbi:hypothetical protein CVT24_011299 [Panaeolus cyanescens]|uniref:Uncharacterized protein n=1 Tax=Panaeolus cyanescens TaxID=181874 RepID=A0A409YV01_9AGAR|nr:hypothetical protein CVT24_011299 [Panaeolus cyanescens]